MSAIRYDGVTTMNKPKRLVIVSVIAMNRNYGANPYTSTPPL
jgi:hypothetical protein